MQSGYPVEIPGLNSNYGNHGTTLFNQEYWYRVVYLPHLSLPFSLQTSQVSSAHLLSLRGRERMDMLSTAVNPGTLTLWERTPTGCVLSHMPLLSAAVHSTRTVAGRREGGVVTDSWCDFIFIPQLWSVSEVLCLH